MTFVYKASQKALKKKIYNEDDRLIFLFSAGCAMLYRGDKLIQSDVLHEKPDSHVIKTNEEPPTMLKVASREMRHIKNNNIPIPKTIILEEI